MNLFDNFSDDELREFFKTGKKLIDGLHMFVANWENIEKTFMRNFEQIEHDIVQNRQILHGQNYKSLKDLQDEVGELKKRIIKLEPKFEKKE